ncbi:sulfite exporter TauE/SafE family protein [Marivita sp. S6314]|uniref:sulfite exporter TauE/SafE family protein n=1 Tax=Marivita sp. S6314 TaxID=2926406 RepID=UPI001FF204D8|nr:sulfite exporter TauE/SafE family protein [Marivita sp. S6314]MCK0151638.1 sulfite exporter TauE/SafE family protein [Marivita sp. S6314]
MFDTALLIFAGLAAGMLNAIAGGGTFISFPALVWVGVPPVMANATATLTALPGYLSSAWAYRHDMETQDPLPIAMVLFLAAIGGLAGAGLLLITTQETFSALVPWLLLLGTLVFGLGPFAMKHMRTGTKAPKPVAAAVLLAVSIYGGYFNGGLGIMLLAAFGLMGLTNLHGMNGLKNLVSALLSVVSVAAYTVAGLIAWDAALVLALAQLCGGYIGARLALKITDTGLLRMFITVIGLVMAGIFFVRT